MNALKSKKRKIVFTVFLFLIMVFAFFLIHLYKQNYILNVNTEEWHLIGEGIYFNVFTKDTKGEEIDGVFKDVDNNTIFYASLQNSGQDRYVNLAAYLNYKAVSLEFLDENYNEQIHLKDGDNVVIPFKIKTNICQSENYKLLISLFLGSDLHESDTLFQTTQHTISYDYFIKNQINTDINLEVTQNEPISFIKSDFPGLAINDDFSSTDLMKLPPSELVVNKGQKFDLAYRIGQIDNSKNQLLIVAIDYKQVKINNEYSLLIETKESHISFGKITLNAPEKEGKYEICALVVPTPEAVSAFYPLENSYRFTLKVV